MIKFYLLVFILIIRFQKNIDHLNSNKIIYTKKKNKI